MKLRKNGEAHTNFASMLKTLAEEIGCNYIKANELKDYNWSQESASCNV